MISKKLLRLGESKTLSNGVEQEIEWICENGGSGAAFVIYR